MQSNESLGVLRLIFPSSRAGRRPVIGWKHLGGPWPLSDFYRDCPQGVLQTERVVIQPESLQTERVVIQPESSGWTFRGAGIKVGGCKLLCSNGHLDRSRCLGQGGLRSLSASIWYHSFLCYLAFMCNAVCDMETSIISFLTWSTQALALQSVIPETFVHWSTPLVDQDGVEVQTNSGLAY